MKKAEVPNAYMAEYDGFEKEWISTSALSCLMMCGIRFYYKYILREREPINIRMTSGSGTHKGREINLSQKIETQENLKLDEVKDATRDDVRKRFDSNDFSAETEFEGKSKKQAVDISTDLAVELVTKDFEVFQEDMMPIAVEESMAIQYEELDRLIVGKIDVREDNYKITDLKTSKRAYGQAKADDSMGLSTYGLLCLVEHGQMPMEYEVQNVVRGSKACKTEVYTTRRTREQLERQLLRFKAGIIAVKAGNFVPANPENWICSPTWCGYYQECTFGGARLCNK